MYNIYILLNKTKINNFCIIEKYNIQLLLYSFVFKSGKCSFSISTWMGDI